MSTKTLAPKHSTAKTPAPLTLQDVGIVDDEGDRVRGADLARLLSVRRWWEGVDASEAIYNREGLAELLHCCVEEMPTRPSVIHFVQYAMMVLTARLNADQDDAEKLARACRAEIVAAVETRADAIGAAS